jgi:NTP pyrophosphatase (non-canonical NTP hydrolase)
MMDVKLHGELTFEEVMEINDERCAEWHKGDESWTDERWITAIVGELGEMANNVKKLFRATDGSVGFLNGETTEQLEAEIDKEWADTMLYMLLFASHRKIRASAAIREVFNAKSDQLGFSQRL